MSGASIKWCLAAALGSALAGCAVGPDYQRPAVPEAAGYTAGPPPETTSAVAIQGGEAQRFVAGQDVPGGWWTLFHSQRIDQLVDAALKSNPDLAAAEAALREARENVTVGEGDFLPTVGGSLQATRQREPAAALGLPGGSLLYNLYNASVSVSYTPDVFGGTHREVEGLEAQAEYQRFQLEATYLSLTANVVTAAVQEASLRGQIAATRDILKIEGDQLTVLQHQFELGAVAKSDVLAQQTTVAQTAATLPPLNKQLAQLRNQITTYAGRYPSEDQGETVDLADLTLPADLPVSLPSKLVEQRPDLRAAEAQAHEASAQIGIALSNMLPKFTLTTSYGDEGTQLAGLFSPANAIWSLGAGLTQPLLQEHTLLHKKRAAEAAFDQAAAQYRSTALKAFQDVANALRAIEADADALKAVQAAETSAHDSLALSQVQFQAGAITYLVLLNAERSEQQALVSLVQARAARYADTAALFQALGGGWWHRDDAAAQVAAGQNS